MGRLPKVGLRGKLSIIIVVLLVALSIALNYYSSDNLADAINREYVHRAESMATFFEAELAIHSNGNNLALSQLQTEIDTIMERNSELQKVSIYAPVDDEIRVIASSEDGAIGNVASDHDAAPIFTGETEFVDKNDGSGDDVSATGDNIAGMPDNSVEMLAPLRDSNGNSVASLGLYLDSAGRDSLIFSEQIKFALITNAGLLLLLAVLFFSLNRLLVKPVKALTEFTRNVGGDGWKHPTEMSRKDEIGDLAGAFDEMATTLGGREEEVRLLLSASVAVSSELHVDSILQILCDKIASSKKVTYCRISMWDHVNDELMVKAESTTRDIIDWKQTVGESIPLDQARNHREVIETKQPKVLRRAEDIVNGKTKMEWEWALTPDTKSALLLPLIIKGELLGIVTLGEMRHWTRSPFSSKKVEFYQILMSQAAVAIENAKLYEKTEWQVRELSIMHKISQAFTSTLDYQEVVSIVAKRVGNFVGAQYASVLLPDERGQYMNIVASYNLSAEYVWTINKKARIPVGSGPLGMAYSNQQPYVISDVETDEDYGPWRNIASVQGYSSLIALPLTAKDQSIGVICIYFSEPRELKRNETDLLITAANEAAIAIENAQIYENLQDAFVGTIKSLAETIDAKDAYTRGHSEKVSLFAEATARGLGLEGDELQTIRYAGYLHDVGKIGIPDAILTKPGKLTVEEFSIIKKHPVLSDRILKPVDFPFPVQPIVRHHHERFDGKGYPDNLTGMEIPLGARILAVADSYEAMTSDRPYRKALSLEKAIEELRRNRGTQFDPRVVDEFVKIVSTDKPVHTKVRKGA